MGDSQYFSPKIEKTTTTTSFVKKPLYGAILTLFIGLAMWLVPFLVYGFNASWNYDFEQGKDSCFTGDLRNCPKWSGDNANFQVSTVAKHRHNLFQGGTYNQATVSKTLTFTPTLSLNSATTDDFYYLNLPMRVNSWSGQWPRAYFVFPPVPSQFGIKQYPSSNPADKHRLHLANVYRFNCQTGAYIDYISGTGQYLGPQFEQNTWVIFHFKFDTTNNLIYLSYTYNGSRVDWSVDNNKCFWPDNTTPRTNYNFTGVKLDFQNAYDWSYDNFYYNPFGCSLYETYETCIGAGCVWYYSEWLHHSYCVEPPEEPEPEECGSFFKCQYCVSEATCEAELCEWKDIGFGDRCYMLEPVIPPPQGEWEAPELENCEGLGTIETWLCEIKNFIAGIFMPTKEKVNEFYATIGAFKEKFPFNYARSLSDFFSAIKTGFATEKDIPIKILNASSTVSFAFWNASATIGGQSEYLKNIVKDFSTLIILLAFLVWLIGFIKRFL